MAHNSQAGLHEQLRKFRESKTRKKLGTGEYITEFAEEMEHETKNQKQNHKRKEEDN